MQFLKEVGLASLAAALGLQVLAPPAALAQSPVLQEGYFKPSLSVGDAGFGKSIDIDDDTLVVAAPYDWSGSTRGGAVHVYVREDGSWIPQATLVADMPEFGNQFGDSVSISGDSILVGAGFQNAIAQASGAAYLFQRVGSNWTLQEVFKSSSPVASGRFGSQVDHDGTTLVISAPGEQGNGVVYVYSRFANQWQLESSISPPLSILVDYFGAVVVLDQDTIVVGDPYDDNCSVGINSSPSVESCGSAGAVYVFARSGSTWPLQAYIKPSHPDLLEWFGTSVDLDGDRLVVGAPRSDVNAIGFGGIGSGPGILESDNSGVAVVFKRNGTMWTEELFLKQSNTITAQFFGCRVAVSGDRVVVGACLEDSESTGIDGSQSYAPFPVYLSFDSGAAYLFEVSAGLWAQTAYIKASNTGQGDRFGSGLALQDDFLAVGAMGEASNATGVNGDQSNNLGPRGAVYGFDLDGPDAHVESRTMGGNVPSLTSNAPKQGLSWTSTVDLTTTGHSAAALFAFLESATVGPILGDQWLLVEPQFPAGELLNLPLTLGPMAQFSVPIPLDVSLTGVEFHAQAVQWGVGQALMLTNALELTVGN